MHTPYLYWSFDFVTTCHCFFDSITITIVAFERDHAVHQLYYVTNRDKTAHFTVTLLVFVVTFWLLKWCDFSHMVIQHRRMLTHKRGLSVQHIILAIAFRFSAVSIQSVHVTIFHPKNSYGCHEHWTLDQWGPNFNILSKLLSVGYSCFSFGSDEDI